MSIYQNGNIITMDANLKAEAFCIRDGKFIAIGTNETLASLRLDGEAVIDLQEQTVVPGFNDAHMHFLNYAVTKDRVQLAEITTIDELIEKSREYILNREITKGQWIISRGWNDNHFTEKRLPNRYDLDKISTEHPIFFARVCGHIGVANSKALEVAGLTDGTPDPDGGILDRENGKLTGILRENALGFVYDALPAMTVDEIKKVLKASFEDVLRVGLTTIQTEDLGQAGTLQNLLTAYKELDEEGALPIRVTLQLNLPEEKALSEAVAMGLKTGVHFGNIKVGPVKLFQDGSLGGRTAAMKAPYDDTPTQGVSIYSQEDLNQIVTAAHQSGFQIAIHAIGDMAMEMILNAYEKLDIPSPEHVRPTIIHCQFTNAAILHRFLELGVVANVQPSFVMTDWPIVLKAVGAERAKESYAWKSILAENIPMAFSSDAPIENFNPMYGIYAAVTRKNLQGNPQKGWNMHEALTVEEALRAFTLGSAYAEFEENNKGSITVNKDADFIILSHDPFSIPSEELKNVQVLATYVGGTEVYRRS